MDFLQQLREEESEPFHQPADQAPDQSSSIAVYDSLDELKVLFFGSESTPISHSEIQKYKSSLASTSAGVSSTASTTTATTALPVGASSRTFSLSDEASLSSHSEGERQKLQQILNQVVFDVQPIVRAWAGNFNPDQFYNFGLNEKLFHEYLEQQILIRLSKATRKSVEHHQTSSANRSLFVSNLPQDYTNSDLAKLFTKFGELDSVAVRKNGNGYVNFQKSEDAAKAMQVMNGFPLDGNFLSVVISKSQASNFTRR